MQHVKQLVEFITGMDTRIGYPNEHLAGNSSEEISSPLYATAVGLVMNSIQNQTQSAVKITQAPAPEIPEYKAPEVEVKAPSETPPIVVEQKEVVQNDPESTESKIRKSFFDRYVDRIKEFLDNAE